MKVQRCLYNRVLTSALVSFVYSVAGDVVMPLTSYVARISTYIAHICLQSMPEMWKICRICGCIYFWLNLLVWYDEDANNADIFSYAGTSSNTIMHVVAPWHWQRCYDATARNNTRMLVVTWNKRCQFITAYLIVVCDLYRWLAWHLHYCWYYGVSVMASVSITWNKSNCQSTTKKVCDKSFTFVLYISMFLLPNYLFTVNYISTPFHLHTSSITICITWSPVGVFFSRTHQILHQSVQSF